MTFAMTRPVTLLAALAIATTAFCTSSQAQSGPFKSLAGVWSGTGTIFLEDGSQERIRCRATYTVSPDGAGLNQGLLCASDSYKFDLRSDVIARGTALSGSWTETSRNVSGDVQGRAANDHFDVVVSAPLFTANLSLATHGKKQNIEIRSQGQFRGVTITLAKS